MRGALAAGVMALLAACSTVRVPSFPMQALASPHAVKGKFYLAEDGTIEKYTVYVTREGIPDWVHKMADEKLGQGPDKSYEVELYADRSEVYEVRRTIGGRERELSVKRDGSLMYVETQLEEKEVPEPVRAAVAGVKGFAAETYALKEGPGLNEYQVRGKIGGVAHRVRVTPGGKIVAVQKQLPGAVEVAVRR